MKTRRPAFEQIEKEFGPMIWRIAASYETDKGLAEELAQEIRLAVWLALPAFREQSSLRTFVARIAINRAITHVKRRMRLPPGSELPDGLAAEEPNPEQDTISRQRNDRLLRAVQSLPLSLRQVATLTLEGLGLAEIANVLGLTANAATIRLSRAKEALRQSLGEDR